MSKRDDHLLLIDILEAASNIFDYLDCTDTYEAFISDKKTMDAVIRNFEIIGEASSRISSDFKLSYPHIEWREMSDFRNKLIHEYFGIDYEIVWNTIHDELKYNTELLKNIP